jgi:signal transduction histidine kinase
MSLRKQLLAFGLLMLVLPWAGYRFVQEMEGALRAGLEQALLASADTVAAALDDAPLEPEASPASGAARGEAGAAGIAGIAGTTGAGTAGIASAASAVYAETLREEPRIDGLREDDWSSADASGSALGTTRAPPRASEETRPRASEETRPRASEETPSPASEAGLARYWAGIRGRYLYLYVDVPDADIVYPGSPGVEPYGDRLLLALEPHPGVVDWLLLSTGAPGAFRAQTTAPPQFKPGAAYEDRVVAEWRETAGGYAVEIRVPLALAGVALGLAVIDVDPLGLAVIDADPAPPDTAAAPGGYAVTVTATWDLAAPPGALVHRRPELEAVVAQFGRPDHRYRVLNREGWVLADTGALGASAGERAPSSGLGDRLFEALLRRDDPSYAALEPRPGRIAGDPLGAALGGRAAAAWYRSRSGPGSIVAAAAPIERAGSVQGVVMLEQASDPILTVTNRALVRLMSFTLLATFVAGAGLLGFATLLSLRVRRLARAAETALGPRGEIAAELPGRAASDEIGDLARSFGNLLERLREHTEYLKTLAGKLSHELRTPLAVVSTSLDNLEQEITEDAAGPYLARLRQGAGRLDAILAAMSEATRMEQAIGDAVPELFDLAAVVESCAKAYADIYPARRFACRLGAAPARTRGSAELTAQLMDKLVDNAVSFSPPGTLIEIEVAEAGADYAVSVKNSGPLLPETMRSRLFDSLVSVRARDDGHAHLGLGLHIVALIAEFHGGRAEAFNLPDGSGVVFNVAFPRAS